MYSFKKRFRRYLKYSPPHPDKAVHKCENQILAEILWFLFLMIKKLKLFKHLTQHLADLLNTDNPYFGDMVDRIYPPELQLNKANVSNTEAPFLDLHLSVSN